MTGKSTNNSGSTPAAEDYALTLAQERIVVETQAAIHRLLRRAGLKQSDLADLLGVSEARVSQMFGDNARNLTLRTVARIFHVLGSRCRIVDDAEAKAKAAATDFAASRPEKVAAESAPIVETPEAEARREQSMEPLARRSADAWLIDCGDVFELLSEDAAFASSMVWVSDHKVVPANENHPSTGAHGRRSGDDVRRWAAVQDRYAFG